MNFQSGLLNSESEADHFVSRKLKAGLIIDLPFHEANKWVSATTWHLVEGMRACFDCLPIQNQSEYESAIDQLDLLISMEPGWAAPKLNLTRTADLRKKLARIPSYILYSDPHANKWRQDYFLSNAFDYILSYYYYPMRYHFRTIDPNRIVHFPWAVPDPWIGTEPIQYHQEKRLHCFGGQRSEAYSLRNWCRHFDFVQSAENSGCENKVMTEAEYIQWLREKDACIAAGSDDVRYRLTVPKYFEIAAAGSLLFAQETDDLRLLGFEHGKNCIFFHRDNFERLAHEYLEDPETYLAVRENGRELIRRLHRLSVRMQMLTEHVFMAIDKKGGPCIVSLPPEKSAARMTRLNEPAAAHVTAEHGSKTDSQARTAETGKPCTKKVLFIVDKPGWAHDFKTDNLRRCLGSDYRIDKRYSETVRAEDIQTADLVLIYYWKQIQHENLQKLIPVLLENRSKLLMGICSHGELQGRWQEPGLSVLRKFAGGIFVNSKLLFEEFASYFDVPVFYTPNGVDTEFFQPGEQRPVRQKLVVGWAGSLKNHGNIRGYDDAIVPAVEKAEGAELLTAARENKWRNPEQMRQFYRDIDVYICASSAEGTPNPCLEAAACGIPILTTPVGNMPELIRPGVNGYFIERNVESIVSKLDLLSKRKDLLQQLRKGIRESIQPWDWKNKARNYQMMFDTMLAAAENHEALFQSRGQVYMASADRMDRILSNVQTLRKMPSEKIDHYISVVGGLSGLNCLLSVDPAEITFFDLNPHALGYAKLVLELISISTDHRDFLGRVFARSVTAFLSHHKQAELTLKNQPLYLSMPVEQELLSNTLSRLSEKGCQAYKTYLMPYLSGQVLEGVRNCRCLLPCFGIHERVPVGGGKDKGYNETGQLVPNINTFFYGHGWLASKEAFLRVRTRLKSRRICYIPFNLLSGDLDVLADFSGQVVLHASNIDDWAKEQWNTWLASVAERSVRSQGMLWVVTTNGGVVGGNASAHARAYVAIEPYVYGRVVEVTYKTPWGFHEFERQNILYSDYLTGTYPADTTILHILVGEGLSVNELEAVFRRALQQSKRVLVMEHNRDSSDWTADKAAHMLDIAQVRSLLDAIAGEHDALVTAVQTIAGRQDLQRNVLFIVECSRSHDLAQGIIPESNLMRRYKDLQEDDLTTVSLKKAFSVFQQAHQQFELGNMVTAQRLVARYRKSMDYRSLKVIRHSSRKTNPLLSVILVTYNRPQDAAHCTRMLRNQRYHDFEIVVVDNGDRDKKADSLANTADVYIDCPINFNLSEGRNIGAQFASGQILVMLDDDALIGPEYLESIRLAFERYEILGLRGRAFPKNGQKPDRLVGVYDLGETPFVTMCNQEGNSAFRRDAYLAVGGMDPLLFGHEGTDLTYRLMQRYNHSSAVIYWPGAVIYHDYGGEDKYQEKRKRYERNRDYLRYKYDIDVIGLKDKIQQNALRSNQSGQLLGSLPAIQPSGISRPKTARETDGPKVSVIMACHNAADFLAQTLDTILVQTLRDWELLVTDDASTDKTRALLESYAARDSRIRLWFFDEQRGPYVRRNFAIKQARSPFICIHDADDLMAPGKLDILHEAISRDDRLGIVGSFYRRFSDVFRGEDFGDRMEKRITHRELMEAFAGTWHLCWHGSAIIRKSLFETIGPYDNQPYGSDTFWLSKAGLYGFLTGRMIFKNLPEFLTFKREHAASQTGKISPVDPRNRRHQLERYYLQKLQQILNEAKSDPSMDVSRALKNCTCTDFIAKFGHLFDQWESAPVDETMIRGIINRGLSQFAAEQYVSSLITLNGLDGMIPGASRLYQNLNFTRGLAYYACSDDRLAIENIRTEIELFRNTNAKTFLTRYLQSENRAVHAAERRANIQQFIAETLENRVSKAASDGIQEQFTDHSSDLQEALALAKHYLSNGKTREALTVYQGLLSDKTVAQHVILKDKLQKLIEGIRTERALQMLSRSEDRLEAGEKYLRL